MSYDVIERVRRLAPVPEAPDELARARERQKLTGAIVTELARAEAGRGSPRPTRRALPGAPRRRAYFAGVVAAMTAAVGIAVPLSIAGGTSRTPVLKLASYSLRLPAKYHLTAATASACTPMVLWAPPAQGGDATTPSYAPTDAAAATAAGGCLVMVLAPPYTPTAAQPDPEAAVSGKQPAQVGPYHAYIRTGSLYYDPWTKTYGPVETVLYVEVPLPNGQVQDLVVGEQGLSQPQLIALVAKGLSVTGTSATAGNSAPGSGAAGDTGAASGNPSGGGPPNAGTGG